ncbi:MAG: hypothetical protein EBY17_28555 [Acidobacteriia bacterium]|nr:hypothetical protein [Terriglobia bacterium]
MLYLKNFVNFLRYHDIQMRILMNRLFVILILLIPKNQYKLYQLKNLFHYLLQYHFYKIVFYL